MEFIIVAIIVVIFLVITKSIFGVSLKEIKQLVDSTKSKKLDELTKKYPDNKEICKWYLKKLNNKDVQIEENEGKENCLYIAVTNKILIANVRNSYTRIQTIAHECLHSVQGKKILMSNFIFSNIYLLYFAVISILAIFKLLPYKMLFLGIQIFLSMVYLLIRNYLENDAMTKARYLAKDYMDEIQISSKDEINEIVSEFDKINLIGIRATNYQLFLNVSVKIVLFCIICAIF
ncbi:MAG: hypothetical protein J5881_00170 [Clostridia bacterium]|nr:hypothetical protein [Clostridia bacterium]